jgi:hypothetical protein
MALEIVKRAANSVIYKDAGLDASTTSVSVSIDVTSYNHGTYQIVWSGFTGTATYEIQVSVDGVHYDTVTGSSANTSGASGSASESFTDVIPGGLIRLAVTSPATAGSVDFFIVAKKG